MSDRSRWRICLSYFPSFSETLLQQSRSIGVGIAKKGGAWMSITDTKTYDMYCSGSIRVWEDSVILLYAILDLHVPQCALLRLISP